MSEKRLMKTPEELRQKARELLQMPKEDILTQYMFMEQEIEKLNNIINEIKEYFEDLEIFAPSRDIKYDILDIIDGSDKE